MSRLYCEHMVPIDEECEECPPPVDLWECARAWQALRDWLDGTAEEWRKREADAYTKGFQHGTPKNDYTWRTESKNDY